MNKEKASSPLVGLDVEQEIKRFLLEDPEIRLGVRDLDCHVSLMGSGLIDSLAVLNIISFLEFRFDVQFEPEDLTGENFDCMSSMAELVRSRMKDARGTT